MKDLYIYCSGGLGREVCDSVELIQKKEKRWNNIYFIDDIREEKEYYGKKVFSYNEFLEVVDRENTEVIIANGEPYFRKMLFEKVEKDGIQFAQVIGSTSFVSPTAKIGKGVLISENCNIFSQAILENNVHINANVFVGHNSRIEKHTGLSIGCSIAGDVTIGEMSYIANCASVNEKINIGSGCIVAANSAVISDVIDEQIVGGVPARFIKENTKKRVFK